MYCKNEHSLRRLVKWTKVKNRRAFGVGIGLLMFGGTMYLIGNIVVSFITIVWGCLYSVAGFCEPRGDEK